MAPCGDAPWIRANICSHYSPLGLGVKLLFHTRPLQLGRSEAANGLTPWLGWIAPGSPLEVIKRESMAMRKKVVAWIWEDPDAQEAFAEWEGFPDHQKSLGEIALLAVDKIEALLHLHPPLRVLDGGFSIIEH